PDNVDGQIGVPDGVEDGTGEIPITPVAPPAATPPAINNWAEVMPEYIGGEDAMFAFIRNNLVYPPIERENGIGGNAIVSFVVNEDGHVSDLKTSRATTRNFQRASEEVIAKMPKFRPGRQGDRPVKVRLTVPRKFVSQ